MSPAGGSVFGSDHSPKVLGLIPLTKKDVYKGVGLLLLLSIVFLGPQTTPIESSTTSDSTAVGALAPSQYLLYLPTVFKTAPPIRAPVLKWQHAGCYPSWCETGWYSSPAVADLEGDGDIEVVGSAYSIFVFDGPTGNLEWRVKSGHDRSENPDSVSNVGRTWAGIVIADVDNDNQLEIVTAHHEGYVSIYNSTDISNQVGPSVLRRAGRCAAWRSVTWMGMQIWRSWSAPPDRTINGFCWNTTA